MPEDGQRMADGRRFEVGEIVRICSGPFASFRATVNDVDAERLRLGVAVSVYGRIVPAELEVGQVEKAKGGARTTKDG